MNEESEMKLESLKYLIVGAIIGAFIWFLVRELDFYANIHLYWQLYPTGDAILAGLAVIIGTYVGMWTLGRIRKPSTKLGVLVGLFSFVLVDLFDAFGILLYWMGEGWGTYGIQTVVIPLWLETAPIRLVTTLATGLIGMILVNRLTPSFCPNCGGQLPPGRDACPQCRTKV